jgi:hypothetical protein
VICRDILYPAIIYANPGRNIVTSQLMNYPDGSVITLNDGNRYPNYATRMDKRSFSSHGRFFEGHCIWDNSLERYNSGTSFKYYSGHGTGVSGISAQYKNMAEQFPSGETRHEHLQDFDWWDGWRGYSGYDNTQTNTPRWGGTSSYNAQEPGLYDFIHFKWVDQLFENLHSEIECWSSCTTACHFGPMIYLAHGSAMFYGNGGGCYGVQDDLLNSWIYHDVFVNGDNFGEAHARYKWLLDRDYSTLDPNTLYGESIFYADGQTSTHHIFGDPAMTIYNPVWIEPIPIYP